MPNHLERLFGYPAALADTLDEIGQLGFPSTFFWDEASDDSSRSHQQPSTSTIFDPIQVCHLPLSNAHE